MAMSAPFKQAKACFARLLRSLLLLSSRRPLLVSTCPSVAHCIVLMTNSYFSVLERERGIKKTFDVTERTGLLAQLIRCVFPLILKIPP
jgi:hypothetical protein